MGVQYHLVWIPKCRRKGLYGQLRRELGEVFHELARQKRCHIEEGIPGALARREMGAPRGHSPFPFPEAMQVVVFQSWWYRRQILSLLPNVIPELGIRVINARGYTGMVWFKSQAVRHSSLFTSVSPA